METSSAALLNPPLLYYAKRKGFREVLDVGAHVKMPLGGLTTMASTIQNRPAEMRRLIRAMQIAKRSMLQSKEKSVDVIIRFLKSTEKPRKRHLQIIKRPSAETVSRAARASSKSSNRCSY